MKGTPLSVLYVSWLLAFTCFLDLDLESPLLNGAAVLVYSMEQFSWVEIIGERYRFNKSAVASPRVELET